MRKQQCLIIAHFSFRTATRMSSDKEDKDLSSVQIIGTQVGVTCEPQIHCATNIWSVN